MAYSLAGLEKPKPNARPVPIPERHGEPSVFKHVIYIIKENRTYDQVFGDMKEGNGDPNLVLYGEDVTPNQHKLAREFTLFDNFYCSGVLSADGHQWVNEAYVTDYLEKAFGGFPRSYPYEGSDPLAYASSGFLWDNALARKKTFRNFGEFGLGLPLRVARHHRAHHQARCGSDQGGVKDGPGEPVSDHRPSQVSHYLWGRLAAYSHSMVPGGFEVRSSVTRLTPRTSLMMRLETRSSRS